jgi:tetratricopeptide (TPR) repeat protein
MIVLGFVPRWLAVSSLVALLSAAGPARADDLASAQQHFERGVSLYQEHAYEAALSEFQRAYQTAPRYELLFNIAQVHYQLHEYAAALHDFERYLEEGAYELGGERRAFVLREIAALRERVGTLSVQSSVPGASVLLDDEELGKTPLAPQRVDIGRHVLRVEHAEHRTVTRRIQIASGQAEHIEIALEPLRSEPRAAAASAPAEPVQRDAPGGRRAALWTLGVGSLVLGAGAGASFALAYRSNRELDARLEELPPDAAAIARNRQAVRRTALASDVLAIGAGAAALGCLITWLATRSAHEELGVAVGPRTLGVHGSF